MAKKSKRTVKTVLPEGTTKGVLALAMILGDASRGVRPADKKYTLVPIGDAPPRDYGRREGYVRPDRVKGEEEEVRMEVGV